MNNVIASYYQNDFIFAFPAKTSRNTLFEKKSWFIKITDILTNYFGIGECSFIEGLSIDNPFLFEEKIKEVCEIFNHEGVFDQNTLQKFPAISFGFQTALLDFQNGGFKKIFDNDFFSGNLPVPINGLVWIDSLFNMKKQVREKLSEGFNCIKVKVGAHDFNEEYKFLKEIRKEFGNQFTLRLDANGAFSPVSALEKIKYLSELNIHSIEQPIKAGQWDEMSRLCELSPIDIALDEELIGVYTETEKVRLLNTIKPEYLILKPSLLGGFLACDNWVANAEKMGIKWWVTSALESNIGLNAIAQWIGGWKPSLEQGLGTGTIYINNIKSPLKVTRGCLIYDTNAHWEFFNIFE